MFPWLIAAALNLILAAIAFWVRRWPHARRNLGRLAFVYGALVVTSTLLGMLLGLLAALDPFGCEYSQTDKPCPDVRLSEYAATGFMAFLVPTITVITLFIRCREESVKKEPAQ